MGHRFTALFAVLLCSCAIFENRPPPVTLRFHEEVSSALPDMHVRTVTVPHTGLRISVDPFAQLSEKDIYQARLEATPGGQAVRLKFDLHGANKLTEMTTRMRGQYVVVFFNDRPIAALLVEKRITDGELLLEGDLTEEEEHKLVDGINKLAGRWRDYGDTRLKP